MLDFVIGYGLGSRAAGRAASLSRSAAVADGSRHVERVEDLNERIDKLLIIVRAMWALMEEQGLSAEDLIAKIAELDQLDGITDGVSRAPVATCHSCDSKVASGLSSCQFCGAEILRDEGDPIGHL